MNVEVMLDGLTWGDLRAFVSLSRDEQDNAEVYVDYEEGGEARALVLIGVPPSAIGVVHGS